MDLVVKMNFWDSFSSVRTNQQTDPNKETSSSPVVPAVVVSPSPDHNTTTSGTTNATSTPGGGPAAAEETPEVVEPSRDEISDPSRGDQEGESRDHHHQVVTTDCQHSTTTSGDVSVFSTLTELFFNPFLDGYCQTPFCSDGDYLPPSCPSGRFYTQQQVHPNEHHQIHNRQLAKAAHPQQDYHHHGGGGVCDDFVDICRSNSAASSAHSSNPSAAAVRKRHRQRPLAFAVGHGDEWKDLDGRRVVITRSGGQASSPTRRSPYRYRQQQQQQQVLQHLPQAPSRCTCKSPESENSLTVNANSNPNQSPHQASTKSILCKACQQMQDLEVPPSQSSGTISSHSHTPLL